MDTVTAERRSEIMRRVRSKHTGPELAVGLALRGMRRRFQLHRADLPGNPDFVLARDKVAIFVHGCFWHRHDGCRRARVPQTRRDYWLSKFASNARRDRAAKRKLRAEGWRVLVVWECQTSDPTALRRKLERRLAKAARRPG